MISFSGAKTLEQDYLFTPAIDRALHSNSFHPGVTNCQGAQGIQKTEKRPAASDLT